MRGDQLLIRPEHTARASELCPLLLATAITRRVITVAGESGAGKSELGSELARLLSQQGVSTAVVQQDDYFVFPPRTNHRMRKQNIEQVGMYEVKLGLLDSNLRSYKRGENPIYHPHVDYAADAITWHERDLSPYDALVVEGTYTTSLRFADQRIFIDRTYRQTEAHRRARGRDVHEPFIQDVLQREHAIIAPHREQADFMIDATFETITSGVTSHKRA